MPIGSLEIVTVPNPILRQVCEPCELGDKSLKKLAKQMAKAMYDNNGCGIAAPQVGVLKRLIVIDCDQDEGRRDPLVLVNPILVETRGEMVTDGEGCLSCPGITVNVTRPEYAVVRFFDLDGEEWQVEGDGLLGRCLQHEIDHLEGRTLFESCSPADQLKAYQDYDLARLQGAKPGETGR